ncbi:MAG: class I SAM-dependent methyltransferase [Candidatus Stahlbacteria bacterium]|nr:MAG: class I SAM-dependent methyltransferase [Candidatus Stahlbacteria bacterium]
MKEIEDLKRYYSDRAKEYDETAGYKNPVAEKIRKSIKLRHQNYFKGHDVLEIACGTGYWTEVIAETANSVLAIDISKKMISIAKKRLTKYKDVDFAIADAYILDNVQGEFSAAYAHWWCSHIPKSKIRNFLLNLHKKLISEAFVLFADHLPHYLEKEIKVNYNEDGDRLEERILKNRKKYLVVKNFPSKEEIYSSLSGLAKNINFQEYEGYWELYYTVLK